MVTGWGTAKGSNLVVVVAFLGVEGWTGVVADWDQVSPLAILLAAERTRTPVVLAMLEVVVDNLLEPQFLDAFAF